MSWTPRSAMVRAAWASSSRPISSMMMTWGHVVLDGLDHHLVLERGGGDLHTAGASNAVVGDVAVAGDLVGGVDDDDAAVVLVGEDAGDLAQHRGLAHAGASQEEHAATGLGEVVDDLDGAERRRGRRGR